MVIGSAVLYRGDLGDNEVNEMRRLRCRCRVAKNRISLFNFASPLDEQ